MDQRTSPSEEFFKPGPIKVRIDLIGRFVWQGVDDVLSGANERWIVDVWFHGFGVKEPGIVLGMLRVGRGPAGEEVPVKPASWLADVEDAVEIFTLKLLTVQELGNRLHLLPGLGWSPFSASTVCGPLAS